MPTSDKRYPDIQEFIWLESSILLELYIGMILSAPSFNLTKLNKSQNI